MGFARPPGPRPSANDRRGVPPAGRLARVTNISDNTVPVIDTATHQIITEVSVGNTPFAVAVSPDGAFAYVANGLATVSVISFVPGAP